MEKTTRAITQTESAMAMVFTITKTVMFTMVHGRMIIVMGGPITPLPVEIRRLENLTKEISSSGLKRIRKTEKTKKTRRKRIEKSETSHLENLIAKI